MQKIAPNLSPIELLLVDDDESDIFLAKRALKKCRTPPQIQVACNGEEALALLRQEDGNEQALRPDIIMLDLNMPRMSGHELLGIIKADDDLKSIPVIVMTMSQSDTDVMESYRLHANAFMSKPIELAVFNQVIQAIEACWFDVTRLPQQRDG